MSIKKQQSLSTGQTKRIARGIAAAILKKLPQKQAVVFALTGDLGSGKTCFVQGLAKGLGIKQRVTSPTFVIMKRFKITHKHFENFYHFDCYRIDRPKELLELGFKEIINNPKNIIAIEWAGRIKTILPKNTLWLKLTFNGGNKRTIVVVR